MENKEYDSTPWRVEIEDNGDENKAVYYVCIYDNNNRMIICLDEVEDDVAVEESRPYKEAQYIVNTVNNSINHINILKKIIEINKMDIKDTNSIYTYSYLQGYNTLLESIQNMIKEVYITTL